MRLKSRDKSISLHKPLLMGILNVTPDSFSDGGKYLDGAAAVARALEMVQEGADMVDIGGESTGPGSKDVSIEEELERVVKVVRGLRKAHPEVWISVDTWKSEVAREALEAGADMVNDVTAFRGDPRIAQVVAQAGVPAVLMYSKDSSPRTTSEVVHYEDVMKTVSGFLAERLAFALKAGIEEDQIILDPGMGAFVSGEARYSMEVLERLAELKSLGRPYLIGASRKSFIRDIWGGELPQDRVEGSLMAATMAILNGAKIIRAHDVRATREVIDFTYVL